MKILGFQTLPGPNVFHHSPMIVMDLDLGEFEERPTDLLPGFVEPLLRALPGLNAHRCSRGHAGGFVERLHEGTYLGHVVEHVALELSSAAGISVGYGKTVSEGRPGVYRVAVRYLSEEGMRSLLISSVDFVRSLLQGESYDLGAAATRAREAAARFDLGPSTRAILSAAEKRGIPWIRLDEQNLIQLGYGKELRRIQASTTDLTSSIGVDIAQDKDLTKRLLRRAFIPVPEGKVVRSETEAIAAGLSLLATKPPSNFLTVKPLDGNHGRGVSLRVDSEATILEAFRLAREHGERVVVEEQFMGRDFRLLVVDCRLVAAAERIPAHVIGDGIHTLRELIEIENRNPLRGHGHERPLTGLKLDEIALNHLRKNGHSPTTVPHPGEIVFLRGTANLSTGGTAIDVTETVHPEVRAIAERAARIIGLDVCGIDLVTQDVARPLQAGMEGIIEVNAGPGLRMHHSPTYGKPRDAADAIVNRLFPTPRDGRIPIVSVTGTNGKTTTVRLISHLLSENSWAVGMTTTEGITIRGQSIARGDLTGPRSAHVVLSDPTVEIAVFETARGGILRRGLAYDWSDVGVLTNIQPDHLGQDGVDTIDEIRNVKALVAERVRPGGTIVLNADDPSLVDLAREKGLDRDRRIVLTSVMPRNPRILAHLNSGGSAVRVDEAGEIFWNTDGTAGISLGHLKDIPLCLSGHATFHSSNILAAVGAAFGLGVSPGKIREGLRTFFPHSHNPGRTDFFKLGAGYVLLDYGHNPEAFKAVGRMLAELRRPSTAVAGCPGDRNDALIRECGRAIAREFESIILKEDADLRGRAPGEVASLLESAVREVRPDRAPAVEPNEILAVNRAIAEMRPGEVVAIFYENHDAVKSILDLFGAEPITIPPPALSSLPSAREVI